MALTTPLYPRGMAPMGMSADAGIVATSGGGQTNAKQLNAYINRVETVAVANDSVKLPSAVPGVSVIVVNATATSMQVFGQPDNPVNPLQSGSTLVGDTIAPNGTSAQAATATGVAQAANTLMIYVCSKVGEWKQGSAA